jgi:hypothetical protein
MFSTHSYTMSSLLRISITDTGIFIDKPFICIDETLTTVKENVEFVIYKITQFDTRLMTYIIQGALSRTSVLKKDTFNCYTELSLTSEQNIFHKYKIRIYCNNFYRINNDVEQNTYHSY